MQTARQKLRLMVAKAFIVERSIERGKVKGKNVKVNDKVTTYARLLMETVEKQFADFITIGGIEQHGKQPPNGFNYSSGVCTASIALFTELGIIIELVNIRTLLVFYLVANALIYRRYVITSHTPPIHTLLFQFLFSLGALGFSLSWKFNQQQWGLPLFGGLMITITAFYHHKVPHHTHADDADWCVPFMPWPPALSIFLNVFLITTLKLLSFQRFAMWACFITLFYVLYGVHSTYQAEEETEIGSNQLNSSSSNLQTKVEVQVL
ncbi:cationic amino acid transporter 6, chloroplastic [Glycine max]|uniref:cationic amino acid transporter 6, chloroplastic n=1 Tax=Glycine max TaxID=3847 RepID=UPI000E21BBDD|nr:cationic amino acid transporter 6, chloroplastic [Glycine max]|eukprot:XP_025980293.1 cationic amino acid transporter 6, chloroplastic-like [Glycine max]